jgi:hypothetical protein
MAGHSQNPQGHPGNRGGFSISCPGQSTVLTTPEIREEFRATLIGTYEGCADFSYSSVVTHLSDCLAEAAQLLV